MDATLGLAGVPTPGEAEGAASGLSQESAQAGGVERRALLTAGGAELRHACELVAKAFKPWASPDELDLSFSLNI